MGSSVRLALCQFGAALGDVDRNLEQMRVAAATAASAGAELVCFPELSVSGYLLRRTDYTVGLLDAVERAEAELAAESRRLGVGIVYGAPSRGRGRRLRNLVVLQAADGSRLVYAKTHMVAAERRVFDPGGGFMVDEGGVGLACCYDLAFPEAMRAVVLLGARVVLVPMAWEVQRAFVMRHLVAARAVENVAYVVAINQSGAVGDLRFPGESCVVDPLGTVVVALGDGTELATVDIDLGSVERLREQSDSPTYPLLADRRPELYGPMSDTRTPSLGVGS
jgi:predicted amidohydrolase